MNYPESLCKIDRTRSVGQKRAVLVADEMDLKVFSGILPGDYLLDDNSFSTSTVFNKECGIFIDDGKYYIELKFLSSEKLTASEVKTIVESGTSLPSEIMMLQIQEVVPILNNSLKYIGRSDNFLPPKLIKEFWTQESFDKPSKTKRRLLTVKRAFRVNMSQKVHVSPRSLLKQGGIVEDVELCGDRSDYHFILQKIAPDYYFVLNSRVKLYEYNQKDNRYNGKFYLDDGLLVIENPTYEFYQKGDNYVKTVKEYYQKDNDGLYRKIKENEGCWLVVK